MIEVCTTFTPRPDHAYWRDDYLQLLMAQKHSAEYFGHRHTVVSDSDIPGFDVMRTKLSAELMPAMIEGVLRRLEQPVDDHICFVDADCLVDRELLAAFTRGVDWDIGLTYRDNEISPINNGVMYVRKSGVERAQLFYRRALSFCGTHWGADQEAISKAAWPVFHMECESPRSGAIVHFLPPKTYSPVPKVRLARHDAFVVHFKGDKKEWMLDYARAYHGYEDEACHGIR